jgi:hypothetical protein
MRLMAGYQRRGCQIPHRLSLALLLPIRSAYAADLKRIHMNQHRPRIQHRFKIALLCFILCFGWLAASCKRANKEQVQVASPTASVSIPSTEEPIIALVSSRFSWPSPIFILYGNGQVIYGHEFQYASAKLTPEEIRQLYTSMDIDSLREWDGHLFTPYDSFAASYFLLIRNSDGNLVGSWLVAIDGAPHSGRLAGPPLTQAVSP